MNSTPSATASAVYSQLQRQQAERNADLAEQRARSLQAETRQARSEADRAQERARSLEVDTRQAQADAGRARSNVAASESLRRVDDALGAVREQIATAFPPEAPASPTSATPASTQPADSSPVINSQGQITGTVINVAV